MSNSTELTTVGRNLVIYAAGVGLAVVGALGIADAIDLGVALAGLSFVAGIAVVVFVHERLDGPF